MYGPNFTNPMKQSGQFVSEINRLNNYKEAKHMTDQGAPPPHQPKLSAENQEKYAAGNRAGETVRGQILNTAKSLTTGDRNKSYGPPIYNLTTYANLCQAYMDGRGLDSSAIQEITPLDAVDMAIFMVLAKVSRIAANRGHKDNYIDGAAYMAIAGECDELLGGG
jgi:hypothetical protein